MKTANAFQYNLHQINLHDLEFHPALQQFHFQFFVSLPYQTRKQVLSLHGWFYDIYIEAVDTIEFLLNFEDDRMKYEVPNPLNMDWMREPEPLCSGWVGHSAEDI